MRFGFHEQCLTHDPGPRHPESPDRLRAVREALTSTHGVSFETPTPAAHEQLVAIHDREYVDSIESFCAAGGGQLDPDTVASASTWDAALASAGLTIWAAENARSSSNASDIPFSLGRPPGHHALAGEAMGFCFFNNVAIGAQAVLDAGGAETVAIFDWDVHHGNGTEAIFDDRPEVPYVSIHEEGLYPGTGAIADVGRGPGEGATLNVPLPSGANTASYLASFDEAVDPWLRQKAPELLLVSAGFDAHRHDPISQMAIDTEGFGLLTQRVLELSSDLAASVAFVLEGGYGLDTLAEGVTMVHEVCGGYQPVDTEEEARAADRERIEAAREAHGLGS